MTDQRNGGIAWTDETWNPIRGCTRVSQGCVNCYAESMAARFCGPSQPYEGTISPETKRWNGAIKLVHDKLTDPLRWARPRRVFVNSMSDLFHENVPDEFIDQVFAVMALAPQHTFQVLTKRPERMRDYLNNGGPGCWDRAIELLPNGNDITISADHATLTVKRDISDEYYTTIRKECWPLPNVWLGVSVEDQETADERIPLLLQTPAAVRWVSVEPMLGPIDLGLLGTLPKDTFPRYTLTHELLHWVVCGGESGPHARPMHPEWVAQLRNQCKDADVPFMFKQWGEFGTIYERDGMPVFKAFPDFQTWVNKAQTWVRGGICMDTDGRELRNGGDMMRAKDEGKFPVTIMHRVGKKAAGRLLDGVLHDEYPISEV